MASTLHKLQTDTDRRKNITHTLPFAALPRCRFGELYDHLMVAPVSQLVAELDGDIALEWPCQLVIMCTLIHIDKDGDMNEISINIALWNDPNTHLVAFFMRIKRREDNWLCSLTFVVIVIKCEFIRYQTLIH